MRLSAQLTDTKSGGSIWSQRFDRQVDDIFAIQDAITNAIAAAIAPEIDRAERSRAAARQQTEVDAWLFYQQGLASYYKLTEEGLGEALEAFRKAQQVDSQFAPAWAMEAMAGTRLLMNYRIGRNSQPEADLKNIATKAVNIDPRDPLCLLETTRVHLAFHDLDEAIPPLLKAVELNPNFALAWRGLANVLWRQNFSEKAIELSPFDPFMPIFLYNRGIILLILKDYGGAISASTQAIQMGPVPPWAKITQVTALWHIGKYDLAREGALQLLELHPNLNIAEIRNGAGSEKSLWYLQIAPVLRELNIPEEAR